MKIKNTLFSSYSSLPGEELKTHSDKLLQIVELEEQLTYYNDHICSLSFSYDIGTIGMPNEDGLGIYGNIEHRRNRGSIFFRLRGSGGKHQNIYWKLRQREIDRLILKLAEKQNYSERFYFFMHEVAGEIKLKIDELRIYSNEWEKFKGGVIPPHLQNDKPVINLYPSKSEEIEVYNKFLYQLVKESVTPESHWLVERKYDGFISDAALHSFQVQADRALNKQATISNEIVRIETLFNAGMVVEYSTALYPYQIKYVNEWRSILFNAFMNGYEFDFGARIRTLGEMAIFFQTEQVFDYYKNLLNLKNNNKDGKSKNSKVVYTKLEDAVKSEDALSEIYKILIENKAIDDQYIFTGNVKDLYSYIRRLKRLLFFNDITDKDLHLLVNSKFKCVGSYSSFRDAPEAKLKEVKPYST